MCVSEITLFAYNFDESSFYKYQFVDSEILSLPVLIAMDPY